MRASVMRQTRALLAVVVIGLVLSGLTAFALETELRWLTAAVGLSPSDHPDEFVGLNSWLLTVRDALIDTNARYPFMAYGTDWLAFGHLVIALMFIGPMIDPGRNVWVIQSGLVDCNN